MPPDGRDQVALRSESLRHEASCGREFDSRRLHSTVPSTRRNKVGGWDTKIQLNGRSTSVSTSPTIERSISLARSAPVVRRPMNSRSIIAILLKRSPIGSGHGRKRGVSANSRNARCCARPATTSTTLRSAAPRAGLPPRITVAAGATLAGKRIRMRGRNTKNGRGIGNKASPPLFNER